MEGVEIIISGNEFPVRYVPQSRYFQSQELKSKGHLLPAEVLAHLNAGRPLTITRRIALSDGRVEIEITRG